MLVWENLSEVLMQQADSQFARGELYLSIEEAEL